ncbi:MAG: hypothetical protein KGZ50_07940 [Peptococcaceae bacterium]|nr:hypothetical protein [Peptococcaceae bacterium]
MYVVQCMTGREAEVQSEIFSQGYVARVPTAVRLERCGGKWLDRLRVLMPGYVFIDSPMHDDLYHSAKAVDGVIRWLNPGQPMQLTEDELVFIRCITPNNLPLLPLEIDIASARKVRNGPLAGLEHKIISVDWHSRRATLCISVLGQAHKLTLSAHFH